MCKMAHFENCDPETADQEYCIFHKPNKSEDEAIEFYRKFLERFKPRVEEIEVEDDRGQTRKVKRFVFEEPVDARGFVFPEVPDVAIEYTDEEGNEWNQKFSFEYAVFKEYASFRHTTFEGESLFSYSQFEGDPQRTGISADFRDATFKKQVDFLGSCSYILAFSGSTFCHNADFRDIRVTSIHFKETSFRGIATFSGAEFDIAGFLGAKFHNLAEFYDVEIKDRGEFNGARFFKDVRFEGSNVFDIYLENVIFKSNVEFSGHFDTIYFTKSMAQTVEFDNITINKLILNNSEFENIHFSNANINEMLTIANMIIKKHIVVFSQYGKEPEHILKKCLQKECPDRRPRSLEDIPDISLENDCEIIFCHPQPLSEAAKLQRIMYERLGDRENADKMFVLEMRAKRMLKTLRAKENLAEAKGFKNKLKAFANYVGTWIGVQVEKVLADWITEYGTNWRRILDSSAGVILGTSILYTIWSHKIDGFPETSNIFVRFANALYYSLVTFTTLGYGDMHPTGWLKALSALEALTGAVFMALIVAVIARKWMR
ncbi:potassium channel family protein [Thermococcus sp.]